MLSKFSLLALASLSADSFNAFRVPLTAAPKSASAHPNVQAGTQLELTNYQNNQYYLSLFVGSGATEVTLGLDTTSGMCWISTPDCTSCQTASTATKFDCTTSNGCTKTSESHEIDDSYIVASGVNATTTLCLDSSQSMCTSD